MRLVLAACLLLALGAGPAHADAALEGALAELRHVEPLRRFEATNHLGRCGQRPECARAVRALEKAVFDTSPLVRRGALNALVALKARGAGGSIVRLLGLERDVTVLPAALLALGALKVQGQDAILVRSASHPAAAVRAAALDAAGRLGGARMHRLVRNSLQMAGLEDEQWLVRSTAILALARLGSAADLGAIEKAFREGGGKAFWMARSAVAKAIAALDPKPREALERMLHDVDMRVAVTAATGLASAGYGPVLVRHLSHASARVRAAAVGGVRQGQVRAGQARLRHMARHDASRDVRWAAAVTLFEWQDPYADPLMLDAVRAEDPGIWTEAVARLARRTGAKHGRNVKAWQRELARGRGK